MGRIPVLVVVVLLAQPIWAESVSISSDRLEDQIKGAWAGQVIGCTYGGPTEFRWQSAFIHDYVPLEWDQTKIEWSYENTPGLYDDVYMDLTFVQVLEDEGLEASPSAFAKAFAYAEYPLWHANNMARYNIRRGIMPPDSGHWLNNPHSNDIDYQIEADFAGIMTPGMPNSSAEISDRVGHIMNYGDGWYGGVYIGAMYSLAFVYDDIQTVVSKALQVIPSESRYHNVMSDVIQWHQAFPDDWKRTWFEVRRKWGEDIGCPKGVFRAYNIDATINSAWVLLGLLYGEGDFGKTLSIATRAGDDSDCNPASAAGILGCMIGYDRIPHEWRRGLAPVENRDFKYTTISLKDAYQLSLRHALEMIRREGGSVSEDKVDIIFQEPKPVPLEVAFGSHRPTGRRSLGQKFIDEASFTFEGAGFVATGSLESALERDHTLELEMWIDGELDEVIPLSTAWINRRDPLFWKYQLSSGSHEVRFKIRNPVEGIALRIADLIVYD